MRLPVPAICSLFILSACNFFYKEKEENAAAKKIDAATYNRYKTIDTLYQTQDYIATKCADTIAYFNAQVTVIKKKSGESYHYYLLNNDTYLQNDSTIIAYAPAFKSVSGKTDFLKSGTWLYAAFHTEKKEGNAIIQTADEVVDFNIDSLPPGLKLNTLPTAEGIYFFRDTSLVSISTEQSEERFYASKKNGFYFIPNSGRLFKKYSIKILK